MKSMLKRALLPLLIVGAGVFVAVLLGLLSPETASTTPTRVAPIVVTQVLEADTVQSVVTSSGITSPAREVTVLPEVGGRIVYVSPSLVPGGRVRAGEVIARIDPRDYELAMEQQRGVVGSAELELELEAARQEIAKEEWKLLGEGGEASPLVLRESQRAAAEMNLASSQSALRRAELDLERSVIRAPFNASVLDESVDVGQVVGAQTQIATLVGTDQLRVILSIQLEDLNLIDLEDGSRPGSLVKIRQRLGSGARVERMGRVSHLVDRVDPETRRAQLLVMIEDPLGDEGLPLLPGASVDAEIQGKVEGGMFRIPRSAVYEGGAVWIVGPGNALERRDIRPIWGDDGFVYVSDGLVEGDQLVTTPLSAPVEGSAVQSSPSRAVDPEGQEVPQ
ncbi:MAG: efflux RND transporter periplasmic adaptor subunit [Longimicrobiales bacterium]